MRAERHERGCSKRRSHLAVEQSRAAGLPAPRRVVALLLSAAVVVVLAGAARAATPDLARMVLGVHDLPKGFKLVSADSGYQTAAAAAKGGSISLAQYQDWGYEDGYQADFQQTSSTLSFLSTGEDVIVSTVSLYRTSSGATRSLSVTAAKCDHAPSRELSVGASIGDVAYLCEVATTIGGKNATVYALSWRRGRFKASVGIVGLRGTLSPAEVVSLARIVDKRIAQATP